MNENINSISLKCIVKNFQSFVQICKSYKSFSLVKRFEICSLRFHSSVKNSFITIYKRLENNIIQRTTLYCY